MKTDDATTELQDQVSGTFTIGPAVDRGFWNKERSIMNISMGSLYVPIA